MASKKTTTAANTSSAPAAEKDKDTSAASNTAPLTTASDDGYEDVDFDAAEKAGDRVSGGFDGPAWVPFFHADRSDLKPEKLAEKVAKLKTGAIVRQQLSGILVAAFAWGRRAYFLDTVKDGEVERVKLPEHGTLYSSLNLIALGTKVAIRYDGLGAAKPGRSAPHLYATVAMEKGKTGAGPRKDALKIQSKDEREALQAIEKRRQARLAAEAAGLVDGSDGDDDLPF